MFNFQAFIRRKWSEQSESTGQKGTVIDELAVKPTGLILGDFYNTLASERRVNDVANYANMSESEMDFFGNKFFEPRIDGSFATGIARIYFDQKFTFELTANSRFVSSAGLQFAASQPGFISAGSFVRSSDRFALYYVDVPVIATSKGDSYNIVAGDLTQINGISFNYKTVTNVDAFQNGLNFEDNATYYTRLTYAINDRSMMNKRSVYARLPEFFPIIKSQYIAGAGDLYMQRDLVEAIDTSAPPKSVTFLGKTQGENLIKSIGFYQIFPYEAGNQNAGLWGPVSIRSTYDYPLTIEPADITSQDPAFHGYALNQECTDGMYKGLFFDDYKNYMDVETVDLFNINSEGLSFNPILIPSSAWTYGANGYSSGNMGSFADSSFKDTDILSFSNSTMTLSGGALSPISAGKDINKRVGVKVAGTFRWPANVISDSDLYFIIGGVNSATVDGYTGVGFGIRVNSKYQDWSISHNPNASLFFCHSEQYGAAQVFVNDYDISSSGGHSVGGVNALAETQWRIEPDIDYDFEFIFHDDFKLTLYINKTSGDKTLDGTDLNDTIHYQLSGNVLSVFGNALISSSTTNYGTVMKVTLDTESQLKTDQWLVSNLRAFDIASKKATAMFALNVQDLESPISIFVRANGSSSVNGLFSSGYQAYIWDKEGINPATGTSELTQGSWSLLPQLSNSDGSKNSLQALFQADIKNLDRYRLQNRFGDNIFIMFTTTGASMLKSLFANEKENDIQSVLHVDYIKAETALTQSYHANNKCDIYLTTLSNTQNLTSTSSTLTKQNNESYFEMSAATGCLMPVANIISVTVGISIGSTQILSNSDYTVVTSDPTLSGSSNEVLRIYLNTIDSQSITVEYITYPQISSIQDFFNGSMFGKVFGDILIKHKKPINLSFVVYYTGLSNDSRVTDSIKLYFDNNIDGVFVVKDMISYLYNNSIVNNVQEPISISYSRYDDDGNLITGTFTDQMEALPIEFFKILSISANTL